MHTVTFDTYCNIFCEHIQENQCFLLIQCMQSNFTRVARYITVVMKDKVLLFFLFFQKIADDHWFRKS